MSTAGYDLSVGTFTPDGRIIQIEYAGKAVQTSSTVVALRVDGGVVFAVEKPVSSKLMSRESQRRIHTVDERIGIATSGILADARVLVFKAREIAKDHRANMGMSIPVRMLALRIADYMHAHTLYGSVRPFGVSMVIGGLDSDGSSHLYYIDPSGNLNSCYGIAFGQNEQAARTEIERIMAPGSDGSTGMSIVDTHLREQATRKYRQMPIEKALQEAARIICYVHDETRDKPMFLELSSTVNGEHKRISDEDCTIIEARARIQAQEELDSDETDNQLVFPNQNHDAQFSPPSTTARHESNPGDEQ